MKKIVSFLLDVFLLFSIFVLSCLSPYKEHLMLSIAPISGDMVVALFFLWRFAIIGVIVIFVLKWKFKIFLSEKTRIFSFILYLFLLLFCVSKVVYIDFIYEINSSSKVSDFEQYEDDFEVVKDMILEVCGNNNESYEYYFEISDEGEIIGINDFPRHVSDDEIDALNEINELFNGEFCSVSWYGDRIDFWARGFEKYVYVVCDEEPKLFSYTDEMSYCYSKEVGNHWYYIEEIQ